MATAANHRSVLSMGLVLYDAADGMDSNLYKAVKDGKVEYLDQYTHDQFDTQLTPNDNTILHVAAHYGKSDCVAKILKRKPSLICQLNLNKENPLHIATREKKYDVVEALIKRAKELDQDSESGGGIRLDLLRAINVDGDTALHLAVREEDANIVSFLVKEDPDFEHPPNKAKETPLYLASERYDGESMVKSILDSSNLPAYSGPSGRTALHAATIFGNPDIIKMLMERYEELIDKADTEGWTPLHYAAYRYNSAAVRELLKRKKSVGYTRASEKHDKSTALHIAAARDDEWVMEEILSHCPDCWEMVNSKGRNILHIAVDTEARDVIKYIIKKDWLESLMNQKDFEGNTPLHLLASSETLINLKYKDDIINHPRANMYAFNNQNSTPSEVASSVGKGIRSWFWKPRGGRNIAKREADAQGNINKEQLKRRKEREEKMRVKKAEALKKTSKSLTLVATLIATITFAAAFAVPGGYEVNRGSEEGMAVLVREASFKAFVIANTIAVMSSTSSVIFYVFAAFYYFDEVDQGQRYKWGFYLVLIAIVAMTASFISGAYAMMAHSLGLVITTSIIGSITFLIYFFEVQRLFKLWYQKMFPWQQPEETED